VKFLWCTFEAPLKDAQRFSEWFSQIENARKPKWCPQHFNMGDFPIPIPISQHAVMTLKRENKCY